MKPRNLLWMTILLTVFALAFACGPSAPPEGEPEEKDAESAVEAPAEPSEEKTEVEAEPPADQPKAEEPQAKAAPKAVSGKPIVVMQTSKGDIKIELNAEKAPATVANFLQYVDSKFYDGTIFHRVIPDFMVQGGGFTADMQEKPTRAPIKNESSNGLTNERGTIAMARTSDPHSATAQFFINHGQQNSFLNKDQARDGWGYAVFGQVIEGMDVVDAIASVATTTKGGHSDVPVEPVVIRSVRRAG